MKKIKNNKLNIVNEDSFINQSEEQSDIGDFMNNNMPNNNERFNNMHSNANDYVNYSNNDMYDNYNFNMNIAQQEMLARQLQREIMNMSAYLNNLPPYCPPMPTYHPSMYAQPYYPPSSYPPTAPATNVNFDSKFMDLNNQINQIKEKINDSVSIFKNNNNISNDSIKELQNQILNFINIIKNSNFNGNDELNDNVIDIKNQIASLTNDVKDIAYLKNDIKDISFKDMSDNLQIMKNEFSNFIEELKNNIVQQNSNLFNEINNHLTTISDNMEKMQNPENIMTELRNILQEVLIIKGKREDNHIEYISDSLEYLKKAVDNLELNSNKTILNEFMNLQAECQEIKSLLLSNRKVNFSATHNVNEEAEHNVNEETEVVKSKNNENEINEVEDTSVATHELLEMLNNPIIDKQDSE